MDVERAILVNSGSPILSTYVIYQRAFDCGSWEFQLTKKALVSIGYPDLLLVIGRFGHVL